jgi:hypothetical protein
MAESPQYYIKIKDVSLIDMGEGTLELDFAVDSNLPDNEPLRVILAKEIYDGKFIQSCAWPIFWENRSGTVARWKDGDGFGLTENDIDKRTCFERPPREDDGSAFPQMVIDINTRYRESLNVGDRTKISYKEAFKAY